MKKRYAICAAVLAFAVSTQVLFAAPAAATALKVLKVGATPVPAGVILNQVKETLKAKGIDLQIIEFSDYVTPNLALADKQIDANLFQHIPYLQAFIKDRGLKLESAGGLFIAPIGLYSKKYKSVADIPNGATIGIPNDPTNEGRVLLLLASKGFITLKPDAGLQATPLSIASNPRNFKFKELEAAQLPRTLQDVDASFINVNFAIQAGLNPTTDALFLEGPDSPYVNIVAVRAGDAKDPRVVALLEALRSPHIRDFIIKEYKGSIVPTF